MGRTRDLLYRTAIFISGHNAKSGIALHLGVLPGRDMVCVGSMAPRNLQDLLTSSHTINREPPSVHHLWTELVPFLTARDGRRRPRFQLGKKAPWDGTPSHG